MPTDWNHGIPALPIYVCCWGVWALGVCVVWNCCVVLSSRFHVRKADPDVALLQGFRNARGLHCEHGVERIEEWLATLRQVHADLRSSLRIGGTTKSESARSLAAVRTLTGRVNADAVAAARRRPAAHGDLSERNVVAIDQITVRQIAGRLHVRGKIVHGLQQLCGVIAGHVFGM